ncbi:MAG TPA: hypothetical protein VMM18_08895 [Gemmatimonadaceae bacterium]|nr:hypothetical protein [Gemmatimonadaceae bacterium]
MRRLGKLALLSVAGLLLLGPVLGVLFGLGLPLIIVLGALAIPALIVLVLVGVPILAVVVIVAAVIGLLVGSIGLVLGIGLAILRVAFTLLVIAGLAWVVFKLFARREVA